MGVLRDYFAAASDDEAAALVDGGPDGRATVDGSGVDPVVELGTLEALLTGRPYAEAGDVVAERDGGERLVVRLTDGVTEALASTSDDRLAEVAVPWSETEEFRGQGDPDAQAAFLRDLAALAREARGRGERLYCLVVV